MSSILTEEPGPRGQRRIQIANWISVAAIIALLAYAIWRFWQAGEFEAERYEQLIAFGEEWPQFVISGLGYTIRAAVTAMVLATIIGFAMALGRLSLNPVTRWTSRIYVEFFRSIPVLLFILFAFLALQDLGLGFITPFWGLVIGLTAYNSAVLAEIFRAGILSLDKGQSEAASAIGLSYWQSMRLVILPQAVRRMTPAIVAQLATLTKDTSLGFVIGYQEVLRRSQVMGEGSPRNVLQAYFFAAVLYFIVVYGLSRVARRLERQQRKKYGAKRIEVAGGPEDLDAMGEEVDEDETREREPAVSR